MITLSHVTKSYKSKSILVDATFSLPARGIVYFRGPSGCGKTTLFRLLAGLEKPDGGRIDGIAGKKIAFAFQEPRLFGHLTVLENVMCCMERTKTRADMEAAARRGLKALDMEAECNCLPSSLSGGMQSRVNLARCFACGGDILLLDEPFAGLDHARCRQVEAEMCRAAKDCLVLCIAHHFTPLPDRMVFQYLDHSFVPVLTEKE